MQLLERGTQPGHMCTGMGHGSGARVSGFTSRKKRVLQDAFWTCQFPSALAQGSLQHAHLHLIGNFTVVSEN